MSTVTLTFEISKRQPPLVSTWVPLSIPAKFQEDLRVLSGLKSRCLKQTDILKNIILDNNFANKSIYSVLCLVFFLQGENRLIQCHNKLKNKKTRKITKIACFVHWNWALNTPTDQHQYDVTSPP
jgi:hypothetical protein